MNIIEARDTIKALAGNRAVKVGCSAWHHSDSAPSLFEWSISIQPFGDDLKDQVGYWVGNNLTHLVERVKWEIGTEELLKAATVNDPSELSACQD